MPRRPRHQAPLRGLRGVRDRCPDVRADVDEQDLLGAEGLRDAEDLAKGRGNLWQLGAQRVHDRLLQVLARQPPLLDPDHCRGEVIIEEDDVGGILGHVCTADAHCDAHLGLLQRRGVVHAVARHHHDVPEPIGAEVLIRLHDHLLVQRRDPGEHPGAHYRVPPEGPGLWRAGPGGGEVAVGGEHAVELRALDDGEALETLGLHVALPTATAVLQDAKPPCDRAGRGRVVTSDHDDGHPRGPCTRHSVGDARLRRVLDAEEAKKGEAAQREVAVFRAAALEAASGWGLGAGDAPRCGTEHAPPLRHLRLQRPHGRAPPRARQVAVAERQNPFRRAFDHRHVRLVDPGHAVGRVNGQHPLVLRIERNLKDDASVRPEP
mmetsp:Transcript_3642/g.9393  ORF Transcript_3642/g.9393 Transcript_3642/m.9393 type:complete len:377 (+) Transcript_3642:540-1670(+)